MKTETINLSGPPTFQTILNYFDRTDETCRTFLYGPEIIKANRKIVIQHNQLKSNFLHVYIFKHRLNCWEHFIETKEGSFKVKDYAGPKY